MDDMTFDEAISETNRRWEMVHGTLAIQSHPRDPVALFLETMRERVAGLERIKAWAEKAADVIHCDAIAVRENIRLRADNAAMREVLKRCEWGIPHYETWGYAYYCHICGNEKREGHATGCAMGKYAKGETS